MNREQSLGYSKLRDNKWIILIYFLFFLYFIGKANFYIHNVARFPDESVQIGYVTYLEKTGEIIPDFREIFCSVFTENVDSFSPATINDTVLNYLGHPPLYYHLMRLSNCIRFEEDGTTLVYVNGLRYFSLGIASVGILLAFYIGLTRLNRPIIHLLYATAVVSVPMLAYNCGGVNNDALSITGVMLTLLALLRFGEGKRSSLTYWLLALGISISVLSKLTTGLVVIIASLIYLVVTLTREKSLNILLNRHFYETIPLYLVSAGYFVIIFLRYHTVQPSLAKLDLEYFYTTVFYVPESERVSLTFWQYTVHFFKSFMGTWTGIASHVSLLREGSVLDISRIALFSMWVIPLFTFFKKTTYSKVKLGGQVVFLGVVIAVLAQFYRAWIRFNMYGYLGSFQSRYFLCAVPAFSFLIAVYAGERMAFLEQCTRNNAKVKGLVTCLSYLAIVGFCALLIYEDFIYFCLNFRAYL